MKIFPTLAGAVALALLAGSCKEPGPTEAGGSGTGEKQKKTEPSSRSDAATRRTGPRKNSSGGPFARLEELSNQREKRDFFAKTLMELSLDDHDLAVTAVVKDLNASDPANLVSEYLEMSAFFPPTLQLPGMVRLLAEPKLPQLQRIVMEQQLREELGVRPMVEVPAWRPLVEEHLRKIPGVLSE